MIQNIKSILVAITEEGRGDEAFAALEYGLSLARRTGAHLTVEAAANRFAVPYSLLDNFSAAIVASENRRIAELARKIADKARHEADFAGVVNTVESPQLSYEALLKRFLDYARVHDLSVLDAEPTTMNIDRGLIEAALFDSGRPALIVPSSIREFDGRRIVIAWDGSNSAVRATADSLPLLRAAEAVEILSITGEKDLSDTVPGVELAPHLSRHGVNVTVKTSALSKGQDVVGLIRQEAKDFGAGLIVAGGYRHSRLRQWLLGGVTQSLLRESQVPLLMSH